MRARAIRVAKGLGIALLMLVLALVALIVALDTSPGKRFIADRIAALRFENGFHVTVARIEDTVYGDTLLRGVSLRDPKGEFLYLPEVRFDWRPRALLRRHVDITAATAPRALLRRAPKFLPTPPSDKPFLPDWDIDIGQLAIDRFIAEPAVSGEVRIASINGSAHIADGRAQVLASVRTLAGAGSAGGDGIAFKLDAVPDRDRFDLDADIDAPAGGVIAGLLGLREPFRAKVGGKGDWKDWNGQATATLGGREFARLALTARRGTFAAKGMADLSRMFTGATARLLGSTTAIDLAGTFANRRGDVSGSLASDAARVTGNGVIDLGESTFEDLRLSFAILQPSALAANLRGDGLRGTARLDGAFSTPQVDYTFAANRIAVNAIGIDRIKATGIGEVTRDAILLPVSGSAARVTGLDLAAGGSVGNVRLAGDLAIKGARLLTDNLRVRADRIDGKATLLADLSRGTYAGSFDGTVDQYRLESVGLFAVGAGLDLQDRGGGLLVSGKVRARSSQIDNPSVRDFLGGTAVGSGSIRFGPDGVLHFADLRMEAPKLRVTGGSGSIAAGGRIVLDADAVSHDYGRVAVVVGGTLANLQAHVVAPGPGFGIGLASVDARITSARGGYRFAIKGRTDYGPLTADVSLGAGGAGALTIHSANLSGIAFAGSLRRTASGPYAGLLSAYGNGLTGTVNLSAAGRYQQADVTLRARGTVLPGAAGLSIGRAIADARVILYDRPHVVADVQLADTSLRGFDIAASRVRIDYRNGAGTAQALVEGSNGAPFRLAANARLQPRLWSAVVRGRVHGLDVATIGAARIVPGRNGYELLPTALDLGSGKARVAGMFGKTMRLQSRLEDVDLALVNSLVPGSGIGGKAIGSIDFTQSGDAGFPLIDARLTLAGFTRTTAVAVSQPVDVIMQAKLAPAAGDVRAVIRRRGSTLGRLAATLQPGGGATWSDRLMSARLGGGIRFNGPAETLLSFVGQAGHALAGPVGVAADFSCRVDDPCLNGVVRANALTYQNAAYGTRLTEMAVNGRLTGNQLVIDSLNAKAGSGTFAATGTIGLSASQGFPMALDVVLDNARLARSDALSARGSGALRLTKVAGQDALLSGSLRIPESRYQIIRQGAAQVPALSGVRFRQRGPVRETGDAPLRSMASVFDLVRLDINLTAPQNLHVAGMGLESEWGARFHVGGTSAAPQLTGTVELVRGNLDFAGRSFRLTEGSVIFTGGQASDPSLRISASEDVDDLTVNVAITGRGSDPRVAFSSVPGLPQDEILSRILFGSSIANLSAVQAVQLAASLNTLRASGGGLNPLGKLRAATGIDRLRILAPDEQEGRGTALAAGRYLTDDIYLELITDARGFTATQLEVSITPWLSVLSEAGGSGVNSLNLKVKKNY